MGTWRHLKVLHTQEEIFHDKKKTFCTNGDEFEVLDSEYADNNADLFVRRETLDTNVPLLCVA